MDDVAIVGGGLSGFSIALLLQSRGISTVLLESHSRLGGCAGFYPRCGFSFDIGATTLVDFHPEGLGGQFLKEVGIDDVRLESLPGYKAWLPDREVEVAREQGLWHAERLVKLGDTPRHRKFWQLLDDIASAYWAATRRGIKLPIRKLDDLVDNFRALDWSGLRLARYLTWSVGDALRHHGLDQDKALVGLLSMMIEDTVHARIESAPLINSALGISIRGAGLSRPTGGMRGLWRKLSRRYVDLGGRIKLRTSVTRIDGSCGDFRLTFAKGSVQASQVVCAVPIGIAQELAPNCTKALDRFVRRDCAEMGGGLVLCLGVPEEEVSESHGGHRHHQILQDYRSPLGNGNNMFISVSAADDRLSAPAGCRAVMISTHCELSHWWGLSEDDYQRRKADTVELLIRYARRVYPRLATTPVVCELGTPRSYKHYTNRPYGSVGGARLNMANSNQNAVPYDIGSKGFWLAGDTTWPGLGTVACVLGATHVA